MKFYLSLALALGTALAQQHQHFMQQRLRQMQLSPPIPRHERISPTLWFTQKQDNFDDANCNTFDMRYWYNDEFCGIDDAAQCPVFLFLNGEWPASSSWLTSGQWQVHVPLFRVYLEGENIYKFSGT